MKKAILCAFCFLFVASAAQAALTVNVPADAATISAAITAVDAGGTITITNSATYAEPCLKIAKPLKIFAATGQTPVIQNDQTTNGTFLQFAPNGDVKIGQTATVNGGRIKFNFIRGVTTAAPYMPSSYWVTLRQTTGSLVQFENIEIKCTTNTTTAGYIQGIVQDQNIKAKVTFRNCVIDWNRGAAFNSPSCYGMVIGSTGTPPFTSQGGSTWTIDHVRIKGYNRGAVWVNARDAEVNMSYVDTGVLGERNGTGTGNPWGGIINNVGAARWTGRIDHCVFRGPGSYDGLGIQANGSSVTLSRSVILGAYAINSTGSFGALRLGGATLGFSGTLRVNVDHCDIVDVSPVGTNVAAIFRGSAAADSNATVSLTVTNSNIYSFNNKAVNLLTNRAGIDSFTSSNNAVAGMGVSAGYTAGTGDIPLAPGYNGVIANADMRYTNPTVQHGDVNGLPIGTFAYYQDVTANPALITDGIVSAVVNKAQPGWTTLR